MHGSYQHHSYAEMASDLHFVGCHDAAGGNCGLLGRSPRRMALAAAQPVAANRNGGATTWPGPSVCRGMASRGEAGGGTTTTTPRLAVMRRSSARFPRNPRNPPENITWQGGSTGVQIADGGSRHSSSCRISAITRNGVFQVTRDSRPSSTGSGSSPFRKSLRSPPPIACARVARDLVYCEATTSARVSKKATPQHL